MCYVDVFFFKQKTAYEMRISDWSSDVCSSDLPRIRQRDAHPRLAGREQEAAHRRGLADADGAHTRADVLHRVVDRHARRDDPARRVDVHIDVLLRIFRFEEQELCDDQRRSEEHTSELQSLMRISYAVFCLNHKKSTT